LNPARAPPGTRILWARPCTFCRAPGWSGCAAPRLIREGDTVWIPPGEEHWHGAPPDTAVAHLAMQEALDGSVADWLEPVAEAEYTAPPA